MILACCMSHEQTDYSLAMFEKFLRVTDNHQIWKYKVSASQHRCEMALSLRDSSFSQWLFALCCFIIEIMSSLARTMTTKPRHAFECLHALGYQRWGTMANTPKHMQCYRFYWVWLCWCISTLTAPDWFERMCSFVVFHYLSSYWGHICYTYTLRCNTPTQYIWDMFVPLYSCFIFFFFCSIKHFVSKPVLLKAFCK